MKFVTASDSKYFACLMMQIAAVKSCFGQLPTVYDIGLIEEQRRALESHGIYVIECPLFPKEGDDYPDGYRPRALFKPEIMYEFCEKYPDTDVVYLDADSRPINKFDFPTDNIGLVLVEEEIKELYKGSPAWEYIGPYYAGVIFLKSNHDRMNLLEEWAKDLWQDKLPSDTKSLNKVVRDVTPLSPEEYLARTITPKTKIFHTKGLI